MRLLVRVARGLRDAWLIIGAMLVVSFTFEIAYRAAGAIHRAVSGSAISPNHPFYRERWFAGYLDEERQSEAMRWKPFVYYRRAPYTGRYIHVDTLGHRYTSQKQLENGPGARKVWLFGGSTMWGTLQRDSATIPAATAKALRAHGVENVAVTNFGEAGYVMTQEVLELLLQLRDGARPDIVIFYDGLNDVAAAVQNHVAGLPQNESNRAREFDIGRSLFNWRYDWRSEARAAATLASLSTSRSLLLRRLQATIARPWVAPPADTVARAILNSYVSNVRLVECLSKAYGFKALYLWQPSLHGTRKALTPFERGLMDNIDSDSFESDLKAVHIRTALAIDSAMAGAVPGRFLNLSGVLSNDRETIFADGLGHTVERANPVIVDAFVPALLPLLTPSREESHTRNRS